MKVCCELGKYWELMTPLERLGCNHDHCKGTVELEDYLLETCGTFDTRDCISYEDMKHLFKGKCQECKTGEMKELSIYDDWEGMLTCDKCGNRSKK